MQLHKAIKFYTILTYNKAAFWPPSDNFNI